MLYKRCYDQYGLFKVNLIKSIISGIFVNKNRIKNKKKYGK